MGWLFSGRVPLLPRSPLAPPLKVSTRPPFHPYALGLSAYPDGPFSALGPRSLLLPLSPVPQTHSLLFPLLSSTLFPSRFSSFLPSYLSFNFCANLFSSLPSIDSTTSSPPFRFLLVTAPSSTFQRVHCPTRRDWKHTRPREKLICDLNSDSLATPLSRKHHFVFA